MLALAVVSALGCCAPPRQRVDSHEGPAAVPPDIIVPALPCSAGELPRLDRRTWSAEEIERFITRSLHGAAAVIYADGAARLVPGCKLDGGYQEVPAKPGSGRFWASDRLLYIPDEIGGDCAEATHVIGAFALRADGGVVTEFGAILVPLPCPSVHAESPAKGCIGRGLTGSERLERARALMNRGGEAMFADASVSLEAYALAPDAIETLDYLGQLDGAGKWRLDCGLQGQAQGMWELYFVDMEGDRRVLRLRSYWQSMRPRVRWDCFLCSSQPAFQACFPGLFAPRYVACASKPYEIR